MFIFKETLSHNLDPDLSKEETEDKSSRFESAFDSEIRQRFGG